MTKRIFITIWWAIFIVVGLWANPAPAQKVPLIRDAEIEHTIRAFSTPLWQAGGLAPDSIRIILVNDDSLNAFVAGGQNLFINTGLLMRSENASQVIGVIAHESGHIAGGHLSRIGDAIDNVGYTSLLSLLLGGGAAILTGRGDVGAAVMQGAQQAGVRNFLAFIGITAVEFVYAEGLNMGEESKTSALASAHSALLRLSGRAPLATRSVPETEAA